MITAVLERAITGDQGTMGRLISTEVSLDVLMTELPERNNEVGYSRIPEGQYVCIPYHSPKFGKCWHVMNVPGRSAVLIHKGNVAGDKKKGWLTHSRGCILPAWYKGRIGKQMAGLNSTRAFSDIMTKIGFNKFNLKIIDLCSLNLS
jgi:hypothetical protein